MPDRSEGLFRRARAAKDGLRRQTSTPTCAGTVTAERIRVGTEDIVRTFYLPLMRPHSDDCEDHPRVLRPALRLAA